MNKIFSEAGDMAGVSGLLFIYQGLVKVLGEWN